MESVGAALYATSGGSPLVLQALVHENLGSGALREHDGVWVLSGALNGTSGKILAELLEARLSGLPESVSTGLERLALLRQAPLAVVLRAVGAETLADLEEQGFVAANTGINGVVLLAEPYIGEVLRDRLTAEQKALRFQEMSGVLEMEPDRKDKQQLLTFVEWATDAGMVLKPKTALAAAQAAVDSFDPQLVLACCARIRRGDPLDVAASQLRSRAYFILANYTMAVDALDAIAPDVLSALALNDYAAWAMNLTTALLWIPKGYSRIEAVLADVQWRIERAGPDQDTSAATKCLNLARFEFQVHRGEFEQVTEALEAGSMDPQDAEYRLNCASLLSMALATTGREMDAVALSKDISAEAGERELVLRMGDWHVQARVLSLIWSGQWRACETIMKEEAELSPGVTRFRGGTVELVLGLAYTYAGRGMEAADVLLVAAAQLEIRDAFNSLGLIYSALAFAFAQVNDGPSAQRYLVKASQSTRSTLWVSRSIAQFCELMALRWLDDQTASTQLVAAAEIDIAKGRFTMASIKLFGATTYGNNEHYHLLEETSLKRQGPMAEVNVALARAHRKGSAALALQAADGAHALELAAVESRCLVVALDLARTAGETRLSREVQRRLDELLPQVAVLPIAPHYAPVPLTMRERQVAALAVRGMANREIASRIGVSIRTVEGHLYQVFAKTGVTSRAELEQGLGQGLEP